MKKILFFACDPGGANAIIPLIKPLAASRQVLIFGKGAALKQYQAKGLKAMAIDKYLKPTTEKTVAEFLRKQSPDLIVTGTSANDFTEKYLWQAAQELNIPSLAILDQWVNYGIRFSRYGLQDIKKYKKHQQPDYLPTKILVMDDYAKQRLMKEGIDGRKIIATGNPHFAQVLADKKIFTRAKINKIKQALGLQPRAVVVMFASEPLTLSYGDSKKYWGFSEEEILSAIIGALNKVADKIKCPVTLIIKLHPKESRSRYSRLIKGLAGKKINIIIEYKRPSAELIMMADVVCSMFSMVLQEAAMLHKPILSVTIGLKRPNIFVLAKMGLAKSVLSERDLNKRLAEIIIKRRSPKIKFTVEPQATAKVIKVINHYV